MFEINVDLMGLEELQEVSETTLKELKNAARDLAVQAHAHILEQVQSKLHSSREKYANALSFERVDKDTWVINLDKSAMWIEEGIPPNKEMIDDLLKSSKARTGKDGSKFLSVPFEQNKKPSQQTPYQKDLTDAVKAYLRKKKIPYGKLEMGLDGKPKTGLLHSFDVNTPLKTQEGPGQGWGGIGEPRQGPTGIPFLDGLRIYQKTFKDKNGKDVTKKAIMTFRTVSSKQKGSGMWVHPGLEPKHFFEEAADWAIREWGSNIVPSILKSFGD